MTEVRAGLEACISGLEASIAQVRSQYGDQAALMRDINGRPLLGDLYASLGQAYAALVALTSHTGNAAPNRRAKTTPV